MRIMKIANPTILAVVLTLLASALQLRAIEQLSIKVQGTNVVLTWPSETNEIYIIEYRPSLDPSTPWTGLESIYPAAQATNHTSYVHLNVVVIPMQSSGGGVTGGPPPLLFLFRGSGNGLDELVLDEDVVPAPPPLPPMPPLPWDPAFRSRLNQFDSLTGGNPAAQSNSGGPGTSVSTGFYRVVRNGPHFWGITNGMVLSGKLTLPVEVGVSSQQRLGGLQIYAGNDPDNHIPIQGLDFTEVDGVMPKAVWDTRQMTNGIYPLHFEMVVGEAGDQFTVASAPFTVTVSNQVWFPDPWNVAGLYMPVSAQSIHTNGTWHIDIYKEPPANGGTNFFGWVSGVIDTNGFISYQGYPKFLVNLTDQSGNPLPSKWYDIVVFTQAAGVSQQGIPTGPASTNRIWVEPPWPTNSITTWRTQFGIGYMPVFGNPTGTGNIPAGDLEGVVKAAYSAAEGRPPLFVHPQSGSWAAPLELWNQGGFTTLLTTILRADEVRNFYYLGHGNPNFIGSFSPPPPGKPGGGGIRIPELNFVLGNNFANPLNGTNGAPSPHPYRFVWLDGCTTADGNLCKAFGIPKIQNMNTNDFLLRGLRYRAFLGWNGYVVVKVGVVNLPLFNFMSDIWEGWRTPIITNSTTYWRTIREAHSYAALQRDTKTNALPFAKNLIIYGYEGLKFPDTLP